jgi:hypothetical protein
MRHSCRRETRGSDGCLVASAQGRGWPRGPQLGGQGQWAGRWMGQRWLQKGNWKEKGMCFHFRLGRKIEIKRKSDFEFVAVGMVDFKWNSVFEWKVLNLLKDRNLDFGEWFGSNEFELKVCDIFKIEHRNLIQRLKSRIMEIQWK